MILVLLLHYLPVKENPSSELKTVCSFIQSTTYKNHLQKLNSLPEWTMFIFTIEPILNQYKYATKYLHQQNKSQSACQL